MPELKSLGVKGIDDLLGGGIASSRVILVQAPPGSGKSTLCRQFICEGIIRGEPVLYVVTGEPIQSAKAKIKEHLHRDELRNALFVDCYSWRIMKRPPSEEGVIVLASLGELNELANIIREWLKDHPSTRIVIDSISDFLLYGEPKSVFKFVQILSGLVKAGESIALIALETGLHEKSIVSTMNYLTDGTIEMKVESGNRYLRIARMAGAQHPLTWVMFSMSAKGIEVRIGKFFE